VLEKTVVPATPGFVFENRGEKVMLQRTVEVRSDGVTVKEDTFVAIAFAADVFVPICRMKLVPV
jgi:hypothetical protein